MHLFVLTITVDATILLLLISYIYVFVVAVPNSALGADDNTYFKFSFRVHFAYYLLWFACVYFLCAPFLPKIVPYNWCSEKGQCFYKGRMQVSWWS